MNMQSGIGTDVAGPPQSGQAVLKASVKGLAAFSDGLEPLRHVLRGLADMGDDETTKMAAKLLSQLDKLEPSVTMVGQIKSGKTSLVNSMIGWPDLLPADVNPWTSVVTSLHLSPTPLTPATSAKFHFFGQNEWDRLIAGGGRIGELAERAGADEELEKIKAQIESMREKSKARLGRKFEMLLGQQHDYGYFDQDLIERYVCLGDDFEEDGASSSQGRFADITKSASLSFEQPAIPIRLCIRDTPGVNDTFMMREQITIRAIRDSRICVVVLSAHQALSSTDLALIRLISNVKSRDVIIYVNRIDELSDPAVQVPQIRSSILDTLARHEGPADAQIIFGSALWAQHAMGEGLASLPNASKDALLNWSEAAECQLSDKTNPNVMLWQLSGVPDIYDAIAYRISEGVGGETIAQVATSARNLVNGIQLSDNLSAIANVGETTVKIRREDILRNLQAIQSQASAQIRADLDRIEAAFVARIGRTHESFLGRATEALVQHLEKHGEHSVWEYSPAGLRVLLSASYKSFGKNCQSAFSDVAGQAVDEITTLYHQALNLPIELFDIKIPPPARVPPPVSLGKTIALDLKGSWWKSWWFRRRGFQAYASNFHELIKAETDGFIADLVNDQVKSLREMIVAQTEDFIAEQCAILHNTTKTVSVSSEAIDEIFGRQELESRDKALNEAHRELDSYFK